MAGCDKNDDAQFVVEPNQSPESVQDIMSSESAPIFEAGFEDAPTRTLIDENVKMLWSADDEISVFYHNTFNRRYRFDGDTGDNSGTFSHEASSEINKGSELATNYAVYPYSKDTSIAADGTISIMLPAVQEYAQNSFGVGANTMVAVTESMDDYFLSFKNLCGYLKLKLYGDVIVKSIKLRGENNEPIAGAATITAEYGKTPTLTMGDDATSTITLDCGGGVKLGETEEMATEFWIVVPPTNFEKGFNISVEGVDGGECFSMTTKARSIERNTVLPMMAKASFVAEYTNPSPNAIWYTTTDGKAIDNPNAKFGDTIISNTYKDGRGVILFDNDITQIPNGAFSGNKKLSSITMPSSITEIGSYAFSGCSSITSINIPESVTVIDPFAFEGCSGELTVNCNIPDKISFGAFEDATFTKVTIGDNVTIIGDLAFSGCSSITSITIPESVTEIGNYAFSGCSSITCITISEGVTKIGEGAFYDCSSITSISIPESVTEIGSNAFEGCGGELTVNCDIPDAVHYCYGVFYNTKFTKVTISEGVTKIGEGAFYDCSSITSISIPESVTEIGSYTFYGCSSLASDIVIPSGVTKINDYTFYGCGSITSITIPESVTEIGSYAFEGCGGELTVNCDIPDASSYGHGAFYNANFTKVTIGEGVTKIGRYAFNVCYSIKSITIPESVTEIGSYAFYGCGGELTVNCDIPDASSSGHGAFYNANFTTVTIGEGVTKIGSYAFYGCSSLASITIPESVTKIGDSAFSGCSSITSITIPESVTEIGSYAFEGCGGELTVNCDIPDASSGHGAFYNANFTKVTIGEGVTKIGRYAFNACYSIKSITIPESVTEIGSYAFYGCGGELTVNCNIPDASSSDHGAFYNANFTTVTIGEGVTKIGSYAFYNCSSLMSIYCYPTTPPSLGSFVFSYIASECRIYVPAASVDAYKSSWELE